MKKLLMVVIALCILTESFAQQPTVGIGYMYDSRTHTFLSIDFYNYLRLADLRFDDGKDVPFKLASFSGQANYFVTGSFNERDSLYKIETKKNKVEEFLGVHFTASFQIYKDGKQIKTVALDTVIDKRYRRMESFLIRSSNIDVPWYDGTANIYSLAWEPLARQLALLMGVKPKLPELQDKKFFGKHYYFYQNLLEDGNIGDWKQNAESFGKEMSKHSILRMEQPVFTDKYVKLPFSENYRYVLKPRTTITEYFTKDVLADATLENCMGSILCSYQYNIWDLLGKKDYFESLDNEQRNNLGSLIYPRWEYPGAVIMHMETADMLVSKGELNAAVLLNLHAISQVPALKASNGYKTILTSKACENLAQVCHKMEKNRAEAWYTLLGKANEAYAASDSAKRQHAQRQKYEEEVLAAFTRMDDVIERGQAADFLSTAKGVINLSLGFASNDMNLGKKGMSQLYSGWIAEDMKAASREALKDLDIDPAVSGEGMEQGVNKIGSRYLYYVLNSKNMAPSFIQVLSSQANPFPVCRSLAASLGKEQYGSAAYTAALLKLIGKTNQIEQLISKFEGSGIEIPSSVKM
ncbi:hypothetical protein [Polluticoccus soli]|uniref:hypothetical protein n=1 Tax=Polluticoccus soli TaxID=3034150 RepID=UPI0023E2A249|nr:hypothetical protein [Flavipsychrobacter sp. JY13-12]